MKGWMSDTHFEMLERKRAAMRAKDKPDVVLQIARLLYGGAEPGSVRKGVTARSLAAAYGYAHKKQMALPYAHEAWRIHDKRVQATGSPEALCERAASAACVGVIGALIVLDEKESDYTHYIARQSLEYAQTALQDFELYTALHAGKHHLLEAKYLPYISVTESALGDEMKGRELAARSCAVVSAMDTRSISWMDAEHMSMSSLGSIAVATIAGVHDTGSNLYDTIRRIV